MAFWQGFPQDLLGAANCSTAKMTVQFMFDWNTAAASDCGNNPVDISRPGSGSSDCHKLTGTRTAQAYPSHNAAATAFALELESGNFQHLLASLHSSNPYTYSDPAGVESDLRKWGSPKQADYYAANATGGGSGGGGAGSGGVPPHVHQGWADLRRTANQKWPAALSRSQHLVRVALRASSRGGKVKL